MTTNTIHVVISRALFFLIFIFLLFFLIALFKELVDSPQKRTEKTEKVSMIYL